uniref:Uncharacterized protein n=1 Tax=Panagrolaimus sp. JU765 TaxID=591449 RepID=A0AC34QVV2_9BILA
MVQNFIDVEDNVKFTVNETHLVINENGQTFYFLHPSNRQFHSCFTHEKKTIIQFPNIIEQHCQDDGFLVNFQLCQLSLVFTRTIPYNNLLVQLTNVGYVMSELTKYRK